MEVVQPPEVIDAALLAFYGINCDEDLKSLIHSHGLESDKDLLVPIVFSMKIIFFFLINFKYFLKASFLCP